MPAPTFSLPAGWTADEIAGDCATSRDAFRSRRLETPRAAYDLEFNKSREAADYVIRNLDQILRLPPDQELLASIVADVDRFVALRYLTGPPISLDDLETLLDASVNPSALRRDQALATRLVSLLRTNADNHRFPWIDSDRSPSPEEFEAGRLASAVAAAIQGAQRTRRGDETEQVEGAVVMLLTRDLGFSQVPAPKTSIDPEGYRTQAPQPGSFMRRATLGGDNGDFVIGLWNSRILALECKSSNSEINSRKRLNKEAVKNAQNWTATFGQLVLPGVVLRGVFKPSYVGEAQRVPMSVFWWHRLEDLAGFISSSRK